MKAANQDQAINTNFLPEWDQYAEQSKKVQRTMVKHFMNHRYFWQPTHDPSSKKPLDICSFAQLVNILGLAFTSSSSYAGFFVCNAGYLWADDNDTHYFSAFAINTDGEVIAVADDKSENEIYIKL